MQAIAFAATTPAMVVAAAGCSLRLAIANGGVGFSFLSDSSTHFSLSVET